MQQNQYATDHVLPPTLEVQTAAESSVKTVAEILERVPFPLIAEVQQVQLNVRELMGMEDPLYPFRECQARVPEITWTLKTARGLNISSSLAEEALYCLPHIEMAYKPLAQAILDQAPAEQTEEMTQKINLNLFTEEALAYLIWNKWQPRGESPTQTATSLQLLVSKFFYLLPSHMSQLPDRVSTIPVIESLLEQYRDYFEPEVLHVSQLESAGNRVQIEFEELQATLRRERTSMIYLFQFLDLLEDREKEVIMNLLGLTQEQTADIESEVATQALKKLSEMVSIGIYKAKRRLKEQKEADAAIIAEARSKVAPSIEPKAEEPPAKPKTSKADIIARKDHVKVLPTRKPRRPRPLQLQRRPTQYLEGGQDQARLSEQTLIPYLARAEVRERAIKLLPSLRPEQIQIVTFICESMDSMQHVTAKGLRQKFEVTKTHLDRIVVQLENSQWYETFIQALDIAIQSTERFDTEDLEFLNAITQKINAGESIRGLKPTVAYKLIAREAGISEKIAWRVSKKMGRIISAIESEVTIVLAEDGNPISPTTSQYKIIMAIKTGTLTRTQMEAKLSSKQYETVRYLTTPNEQGRYPRMVDADNEASINRRYASEACKILGIQ